MARPDRATVLSHTSSGVPFQWLIDGYKDKGAADANVSVMQALVAWSESEAFLRDVMGYTEWAGGQAANLHRVLPMAHPFRDGLWCDEYEVLDLGAYPERQSFADAFNDNAPEQDWLIYQLTFRRPDYWVRDDATIANQFGGFENDRYCTFSRRYVPRERRKSGFAFEYQKPDNSWVTVPDEAAFIPDYQVEYLVTWRQIPLGAVPDGAIAQGLVAVNKFAFKLRSEQKEPFAPGELLFRGPQQGAEAYAGADLSFYQDLPYVFAFQPGGWNKWLRPDLVDGARDYGLIKRRKNGAPAGTGDPPYPSYDFNNLFTPGT